MSLGIGRAVGLPISEAILTEDRYCCYLLGIIFGVYSDKFLKVLDCQFRLLNILFLRVAFL